MRNVLVAFAAILGLFGGISHAAVVFGDPNDFNNSVLSRFANAPESGGAFFGSNGGKLEPLFGLSGCGGTSSAAGVEVSFTSCVFHNTGFDSVGGAKAYQFELTGGATGGCFTFGGYATETSAGTFVAGVNDCLAAGENMLYTLVAESLGATVFAVILNVYDGSVTLSSASVLFNSPDPVPLPAAGIFLLTGLAGAAGVRLRKKNNKRLV